MPSGVYERTQEMNATTSKAMKNSDAVKAKADSQRGVPRTPEACAAMSKAMQESDAVDAMRGGHDIVNHHYIYDHNELTKYTTKMTRAQHSRLHLLMRKSGIKVPHINIKVNETFKVYNQKVYKV